MNTKIPEPCGCDESVAFRELMESAVVYMGEVSPCREDCECVFCAARHLLAGLEEKRRSIVSAERVEAAARGMFSNFFPDGNWDGSAVDREHYRRAARAALEAAARAG